MRANAMKFLLSVAAACVCGTTLSAQSYRVVANIPFAFHAGRSTLPAGKYVSEKPFQSSVQSLISVENGHRVAVASMFNLSESKEQPRLIFHRYGNEYFLSEIWNGKGTGTRLLPNAAEVTAKESLASNRVEEVTVVMASMR